MNFVCLVYVSTLEILFQILKWHCRKKKWSWRNVMPTIKSSDSIVKKNGLKSEAQMENGTSDWLKVTWKWDFLRCRLLIELSVMGTNGLDTGPVPAAPGAVTPMDTRMSELESLFLGGPLSAHLGVSKSFSIESLVDILMVLFDECSTSSLRREKTVSEFIELGRCWVGFILHILMHPKLNRLNFFVCSNKREKCCWSGVRPGKSSRDQSITQQWTEDY